MEDIYYFYKQKSERVARQIVAEIRIAVEHLTMFPQMAAIENSLIGHSEIFRSLIVVKGLFKIIYFPDETANEIIVVTIWDCRQNPEHLIDEIED